MVWSVVSADRAGDRCRQPMNSTFAGSTAQSALERAVRAAGAALHGGYLALLLVVSSCGFYSRNGSAGEAVKLAESVQFDARFSAVKVSSGVMAASAGRATYRLIGDITDREMVNGIRFPEKSAAFRVESFESYSVGSSSWLVKGIDRSMSPSLLK